MKAGGRSFLFDQKERFFLWAPVLFGAGALIYFNLKTEPSVWLAVVPFLAGIAGWIAGRKNDVLKIASAVFCLLAFGFAAACLRTHGIDVDLIGDFEKDAVIQGRVVKSEGSKIIIRTKTHGNLRTTLKTHRPKIGDVLECSGTVYPLTQPVVPGGFNFMRKAYFEEIAGGVKCKTDTVRITEGNAEPFFERLRNGIARKLADNLKSEENRAVAESLLIGRQENIPEETKEAFRVSGIAHILSVSGFHMSLVTLLFFSFTRLILAAIPKISLRWNVRKITAVIAFVMTFLYLQMSGKDLPAVRSFIMVSVAYLAVLLDRRVFSLQSVALAALCILIPFPESVFSIGFQLSFASVAALIAGYEAGAFSFFKRAKSWPMRILSGFGVVVMTDCIATVATLPFLIYYFQVVPPYSMPTNFITNPLFSFLAMPFLLIGLITSLPGTFELAELGLTFMVDSAKWSADLPGAVLPVPSLPVWGMLIGGVSFYWICLWTGKRRLFGIPFFILGITSFIFLETPDILIGPNGRTIVVKEGKELRFQKIKTENFMTRIWFQRFGRKIAESQITEREYVWCGRSVCKIGDEIRIRKKDLKKDGTHAVYLHPQRIETVAQSVGNRPWTLQSNQKAID